MVEDPGRNAGDELIRASYQKSLARGPANSNGRPGFVLTVICSDMRMSSPLSDHIPGRLNAATELRRLRGNCKPKVQYPPKDPFAQTTSKHSMKTVILSHLGLAYLCARRTRIPASANLSSNLQRGSSSVWPSHGMYDKGQPSFSIETIE